LNYCTPAVFTGCSAGTLEQDVGWLISWFIRWT